MVTIYFQHSKLQSDGRLQANWHFTTLGDCYVLRLRQLISKTSSVEVHTSKQQARAMIGENRQLATNEPVEFEK